MNLGWVLGLSALLALLLFVPLGFLVAPPTSSSLPAADSAVQGGAPHAGFCAVPPAPGKRGFVAESRYGPSHLDRPRRALGAPAVRRGGSDTLQVIAIRVDFEDEAMDSTLAYFERAFFFMGQYWNEVTYGQVAIRTEITDTVYRLPETQEYYGEDALLGERQTLFIRDAVLAADPDVNYPDYDFVIAVHGGNGQEADVLGDSPEQLWSVFAPLEVFQEFLPDSTAANGILTADETESGDPYYVQFALVLPEVESQDCDDRFTPCRPFIFGLTGVYAHEFGHALGLPDLYDTTPSDFADSQGIGIFDIMAHGTWNANGFAPARPCAWSLYELGVLDAEIVTEPGPVELAAVASLDPGTRPRLAAIPIGGDEYFLLENRVQDPNDNQLFDFNDVANDTLFDFYVDDYTGAEFDFFLPGDGTGSGLLIWHVDESVIRANLASNTVESDPVHKGIDLEEADGIEDMDGFPRSLDSYGSPLDVYRAGNQIRFGPETVPSTRSSYGVPTYIAVDSVSAAGQVMRFVVEFDRRQAGWQTVTIPAPIGANHLVTGELAKAPGLETVVADTMGGVWVIGANGQTPAGFGAPHAQVGADLATVPLLANLDADPALELLVAATDGRLHAWNGDGSEVRDGDANSGTTGVWAVAGRSLRGSIPVEAQLGGAGDAVLFGAPPDEAGNGALCWAFTGGKGPTVHSVVLAGDATVVPVVFPGTNPIVVTATVVRGATRFYRVSPLGNGGMGAVAELDPAGGAPSGAVRTIIAGDLDGDGRYELIAGDDKGRTWAYATGVPLAGEPVQPELQLVRGWPFELGFPTAHDLALADFDRDGRHEVLISALDGRLYGVNFNGTPQLSFPATVGRTDGPAPRLVPSPLAIDLTGDAAPELLFAPGDGRAFAYDARGAALSGWPLPGPAARGAALVVEDLDQDGDLELLAPSDIGATTTLIAYDLGVAEGPGSTWRSYRGGPGHRGVLSEPPAPTPTDSPVLSEVFVYPNPVRGNRATIHFTLGQDSHVAVEILDPLGRVVANPLAGETLPGHTDHEVRWDVRDAASGVYLMRLTLAGGGEDQIELLPFAVTR